MITLMNLRNSKITEPYDVKIDRTSPLGNPYPENIKNGQTRDVVCDYYQDWFNRQIQIQDSRVMDELRRLLLIQEYYGQLRIFCWCTPKRCHGETIKTFLEQHITKETI